MRKNKVVKELFVAINLDMTSVEKLHGLVLQQLLLVSWVKKNHAKLTSHCLSCHRILKLTTKLECEYRTDIKHHLSKPWVIERSPNLFLRNK